MSKANSSKTIINTETGETFFGWKEVGDKYGIKKEYLLARLTGKVLNNLQNHDYNIKT